MNAFTAREHTAYYARLPHARVDVGLDILCDVLSEPALRPAEVEAERQVIVEEILMNLDAPEDRVHTALSRAVFGDHSLGREVLGEMATVESITRDEIADFFRPLVPPGDDGRHGGRSARARRRSSRRWRRGSATAPAATCRRARRPPPPVERRRSSSATTPSRRTCASAGAACPPATTTDGRCRWPTRCSAAGWRAGCSRRCARQRGLAYSVYSHPTAFEDSGYLTIYCGTAPKRAREALAGDRRRRGLGAGRRHHRGASWPSRPATSRARCCSASRTAAGAWVGSAAA